MLRVARGRGLRLCGLNAPYALVSRVASGGIAALPAELRETLPDLDLGNREHRRRFDAAAPGLSDAYYESFTLWDEYMAASIAGYVANGARDGAGPLGAPSTGDERMVVAVGSGHVRGRVGIPDRFARRRPGLGSVVVAPAALPPSGALDTARLRRENLAAEADFLLFTRDSDSPA